MCEFSSAIREDWERTFDDGKVDHTYVHDKMWVMDEQGPAPATPGAVPSAKTDTEVASLRREKAELT